MESSEIEVLVEELEQRVDRLRALYEQYFMGIEKLEPTVPRKDVERRLWVLRREQIRNTGLRFKFNMIVQRYNTYQQYWQRILREIEAGTYKRDVRRAAQRFGTEVLTAATRKRFGKLLEQMGADGADELQSVDVEFDDQDMWGEEPAQQPDFGRIDAEQPALAVARADFGVIDEGEAPSALKPAPRPTRRNDVPPPPSRLFPDDEEEDTNPRASAFRIDPASRASEPSIGSGIVSGIVRAPAEQPSEPAPRPALLSALAGPVRRAPPIARPIAATQAGSGLGRQATASRASSPGPTSPEAARVPNAPNPGRAQSGASSASSPIAPAPQHGPGTPNHHAPSQAVGSLSPSARAPSPSPPRPSAPLAGKPAPMRPAVAAPEGVSPNSPDRAVRPLAGANPNRLAAPGPRVADSLADTGLPHTRVRQIYETYVQARRACNESTSAITENGLAEMLRASAEKLRGKHSGKNIDFDVVIRNGKAILKPIIKG